MNLNLRNNSLKEDGCCFQSRNKGWKSNLTTFVLFMAILFTNAIYAATPTVSSFFPASGAQGQVVTIIGTNFTGTTAVSFGLTPAASFTVVNDNTISAVVGAGSTGSVRVTNPSGFGQKSGFTFFPAPSCNLSGILKACLADGNIAITTTVQFSTGEPTLNYSFPAGPQNTTGASIVSTGPFIYDPVNDLGTQTTIINPGTSGGQILYQLNVLNDGGECTCSKSITIIDLGLEAYFNPITCYGGTTNLFVDATSSGSSKYTFTLQPGNIVIGPQSNPSVEFQNIPAGNYTVTVVDNNGCSKQTEVTITQPPLNPVVLNCPENKTETSCKTQEEINASFAAWLESFSYTGGTNPVLATLPASPTAPSTCASGNGNSVQVTWTVTDDCGQPQSCTRTFTVTPFTPVNVEGPESVTASACDYANQAAVDTAFAAWVAQFQTINDGCDATAQFNISEFQAPRLCDGGSVSLTYSIADNCSEDSASATFTITPSTPVNVEGPESVTASACDYANQAAVDTAFAAWVAQFQTINDGCDATAQFNISEFQAPRLCDGGSVSLTYSIADNCSEDSASATFTITPSTPVNVEGPESVTASACDYANQAAVDTAFAAWVAQFQTINDGCDATAQFNISEFQAPRLCDGGSVSLTYSIADNCSEDSASATFTITPSTPVNVEGPESVTASACDYANQAAVDTAFAAWVAQFQTINDGCDATAQFNISEFQAPRLCDGGSVSLTYSIADNCSEDSASATFTITPSTPVNVEGPESVTASACDYANQAAVDTAFAAWVAQFQTINDGCDATAQFNISEFQAPRLCDGGSVSLTYSIADNCSEDSASATFTITPSTPVNVEGPESVTASACDYANQAAVDTAFAAWVAQFQTINDGCDATAQFNISEFQAPRLCDGGSVSLTYSIADNCSEDSASATFTITPSTPVNVEGPESVTASACDYANQAAVDTAFAAWVAQFQTINDGCDATAQFNISEFQAPRLCDGGSVSLTYSIADNCSEDSASATFTITPSTPVNVEGPESVTASACDYANQAAVDTAFAAWVAQFQTINDGCDATAQFNISEFQAPRLCDGGSVSLTYSIADNCSEDSASATFTITPSTPVNVEGPESVTASACDYANQAAVDTAFAAWVAQFQTINDGCDATAQFNISEFQAPRLCDGGSVSLTYSIADNCSEDSASATFTITPSTPVNVEGPESVTASACDYANQAAVDTAFAAWVAQFQTINDGCDATAQFNISEFQAPRLCDGGSVSLTYSIADNCSEDSASATFTITPSTPVNVEGPESVTASACDYANQAAVDTAFAAWVAQFQTINDGCDATAQFNISEFQAPRLCDGGSVSLTYSIADNCSEDSASATFTITPSTPVNVEGPESVTASACDYANQAAVDTAFAAWVAQFQTINDGCDATAQFNISEFQAPRLCDGGSVSLTYSIADNCSEDSASATFTITPSTPVNVEGPESVTASACDYANQAAVDTAFAAWVAQFQTINDGCDATAQFNISEFQAPRLCDGGSVSLTYSIADNCSEDSASATFTITPSTPVNVEGPESVTASACDYANQAAVDTAFAAWVAQFQTINDGCDATAQFNISEFQAPRLCDGGSVSLTYSIADNCSEDSVSATFTITPSTPVNVEGPESVTASACDYANQAAVDTAFAAWVAQFQTINDGCDATAQFNISEFQAPRLCDGGSVSLTYSIADNCSEDSASATFTITPSTPVNVEGPESVTASACDYANQAAVDTAFAAWVAQFQTINDGCDATAQFNISEFQAPRLCDGGSVSLTYSIADNCSEDSASATFTITPSTPVNVEGPESVTASACDYANQAAVDTAFAAWVAQFQTINDGCDATAQFNISEFQAPRLCDGGSVSLTYSIADNCSEDSASATFTITPSTPVNVEGPESVTASACDYANQAAVDTAFAAWVAQFQTINDGCDATAQFNISEFQAPRLCDGGSVSLTYSIADNCSEDSASATFTITPSTPVNVEGPESVTASACDYANQAAVDTAFAAWVAQFQTINDGCLSSGSNGEVQGQFNISEFQAPRLCDGGSVSLTYSIADNCSEDSASATFTITPSTPVNVEGPESVTASACDYANQAAVDNAFAAWVAQFQTINDGCDATAQFNISEFQAPRLCEGGSVSLTYSIADNCSQDSASATFTITPSSQITFNCGDNVSVPACSSQEEVNSAWSAFLASTTANGGCNGVLTNNAPSNPPSACGGYIDVTWTYSVNNQCGQSSDCEGEFKTFTQGGYGTSCNGNNPGCYRDANFAGAFPNGLVVGCGNNKLTFTSSSAIENYLPAGGSSSVITSSAVNPTSSRGVLSGQLVALTLSAGFDAYDPNFSQSNTSLGSLTISSGTFAGMTVSNFLQIANDVIGGCSTAYSLSQINAAATAINENFDNGTVDRDYLNCSGQNSSNNTVTCTKRFTVQAPAPVVFNCGNNVTVAACSTQSQVNSAWNAFLASTTASGGCGGTLTNNAPANPPSICGGYVDVTWTYTVDSCGQESGCGNNNTMTCTKRFTVQTPAPVVFNCGNNVTVAACSTQSQVNSAWNAFLASTTASGGCGGTLTNNAPANPPSICGGYVDVTWTYTVDSCGQESGCGNNNTMTCTKRFTVQAPAPVVFNCGNNVTVAACSTQSQVNSAWNAFLASTTASGGCGGTLTNNAPANPPSICGGYVDVTWTYTVDSCGQESGCGNNNTMTSTKRFTVQAPAPVAFAGANDITIPSCSTQSQVNAAWAAFKSSVTATGGCGGTLTVIAPANPPSICGGYADVTWKYTTSSCGQQSGCGNSNFVTITKRFTVASPSPIVFSGANNVTLPACSTQAEVNAAWAAFKSSVTATGGCGGVLTVHAPAYPPSICGGYADVTWKYTTSSCGQQSGCGSYNYVTITKRFRVSAPSPVVFSGANNVTLPACSTQSEVNAAWAAFKSSVTATGGCGGTLTVIAPANPPSICGGYADVTWKYTTSSCGQQSGCGSTNYVTVTKRFRVSAPSPVVLSGANNVTVPACSSQSQVNAAWAAFKSSVTATGGCGGTLTNNAPVNPPSSCGGYVDVTWTYNVSGCGQQSGCGSSNAVTVTKRFTVTAPAPVVFSGANNVTVAACSTQAQINAAWAAFKCSVTATGGCGGTLTNNAPANPPSSCGGYVDVTWTYNVSGCGPQSGCGSSNTMSVTKRFTVASSPAVTFKCGGNVTMPACSTQAQINAAWSSFLCSTTVSGGCYGGTLTNNAPANPPSACGGYVDVTWTYTTPGGCGTQSCTKRFTVASGAAVDVTGPSSVTYNGCNFTSQYALDCAFANWLSQFRTLNAGCPAPGCGPNGNTAVFSGSPRVAPRLIYGGSVCVTYSISGNCNQDSVTATFTVTRPQNCYTTCKTTDEKSEMVKGLTVKAYPNPFSEVFNISLTTSSDEKVEVSVFDLTGKQLERREVSPLEVSELQIGDRYPSGVYNVIVTQGDEVKTLKVVKR
ncbi:T9SS type A sorting domain-containing protein [Flavobacterium sp. TBRC 19031]|uniref:T9SS type A sorting domain-containing protein n=1 Tax=Flavobacterium mekongense TaxID=3379707 RepID=UPI00399B7E37